MIAIAYDLVFWFKVGVISWLRQSSRNNDLIVTVPTTLRPKLLQITHDIPADGHLRTLKNQNRLLQHFFWPSISRDTKNICHTCDVCQRLGKGKNPAPAPLQSLPLVNEPCDQVAVNIVGPLETGNRFILTVLDLCAH